MTSCLISLSLSLSLRIFQFQEFVPHCMLDILHKDELNELQLLQYARQVAAGMQYLHSQEVLHCDLAARNILVSAEGELKICDFSHSRIDGSYLCSMTNSKDDPLNVRWTAPEVLKQSPLSKHSDIWWVLFILLSVCM